MSDQQVNSPIGVEIALYYHYSGAGGTDYGVVGNRFDAPAVQAVIADYVSRGLLIENSGASAVRRKYEPTAGLTAYVEALCCVKFPVQTWVIPG